MPETKHLSDLWEYTITKIFKHDLQSEMGNVIREWVVFNKLENFNSLLNYTVDDFTASGNLCYYKGNGEILHQTALQELFNLRWYIQHLIDHSGYESDDEFDNQLSEQNWMLQTSWKFIKYVIHNKHSMTPKQLKKKPIKQIIKIKPHETLDTHEGESTKDEEDSTTSTQLSEEHSTFDTPSEATEESKQVELPQIHTVFNKSIHGYVGK